MTEFELVHFVLKTNAQPSNATSLLKIVVQCHCTKCMSYFLYRFSIRLLGDRVSVGAPGHLSYAGTSLAPSSFSPSPTYF